MRLINADQFYDELTFQELGLTSEQVGAVRQLLYDQPTVFFAISGRTGTGKKALKNYLDLCNTLDEFGIDSSDPAPSLRYVLEQYQKVLMELTGGKLSKLAYSASVVSANITDELDERARELEAREQVLHIKECALGIREPDESKEPEQAEVVSND